MAKKKAGKAPKSGAKSSKTVASSGKPVNGPSGKKFRSCSNCQDPQHNVRTCDKAGGGGFKKKAGTKAGRAKKG